MKRSCFKGCFCSKAGFTLIELLVVVLIIGILAAVALPQYKLAIVKSRVSTILPVLTSIIRAEEAYYLANGEYTDAIENLDVNLPAECNKIDRWQCGNFFMITANLSESKNEILADYCPDHTDNYSGNCSDKRDFQIAFHMLHSKSPNAKACVVKNKSTLGKKVCKTFADMTCINC